VFVRGSDNDLWLNWNGTWRSLGSPGVGLHIFGDPSAVMWNTTQNLNVFVLGTDAAVYNFSAENGVLNRWWGATGVALSGPPRAFSRNPGAIDVFAVGDDGRLKWMPYTSTTGWAAMQDLGFIKDPAINEQRPHHSPVGIAAWDGNTLDIFPTYESGVAHRHFSGTWAPDFDVRGELGSQPAGTVSAVSWGSNRIDVFMVDRFWNLRHEYWDGNWHMDVRDPMATDAAGDPIVVSPGANYLDVLYRTVQGSLTRMNYNNGWITQPAILPAGSIQ